MSSYQFVHGRRVWAKRVASLCGVSVLLLAGCSSPDQRYGYYGSGGAYGTTGSVPIPSEPVYGNGYGNGGYTSSSGYYGSGSYTGANYYGSDNGYRRASDSRAPFTPASYSDYSKPVVQRTGLAPVSGYTADAGSSYAMQPVADGRASGNDGSRQRMAYDYRPRNGGNAGDSRYDRRYDEERAPQRSQTGGARGGEYEVEQGDTLYGIAQRFRMTTDELMEINGLRGPDIHPGQRLRVSRAPYTSTSTSQAPSWQQPTSRGYNYDNGRGNYDNGRYNAGERGNYSSERSNNSERSYSNGNNDRNYGSERNYSSDRAGYTADRGGNDSRRSGSADGRDGYADERAGYAGRRESTVEKRRGYDDDPAPAARYRPPVSEYAGYGGRRGRGDSLSYSVKRGDTIFEIARRNGISHRELADYNDIPPTAKLYPGQVLHIPKGKGYDWGADRLPADDDRRDESSNRRGQPKVAERAPEKAADRGAAVKPGPRNARPVAVADARSPGKVEVTGGPGNRTAFVSGAPTQIVAGAHEESSGPRITGEGTKVAPRECESLLANPAQRTAKTFREPVQGVIVSKFGSKEDGSFNDGINFSVPKGTPVKATENGVVAYAGDELAGFGNLILIRHADGFVSAYANNDEVMVRRCDVVKRGQTISKAGATGNATKPQLHFELRKDSKPIDPEAFFSRS